MKQVLIIEHNTTPLQKIKESIRKNILGGIFTEFDVMNRNERIYTADKFLPAYNEMCSRLKQFGVVYGALDHPEDFNITLERASHAIIHTEYLKNENRIDGQIQLLSTDIGKKAQAIIFEDGLPLFVSSRGAGVTTGNNRVEIKKLFTYDLVADPGFASAEVTPLYESFGLPINESLGYSTKQNYRIYEMSNETDINNLFNMTNQNDYATQQMLSEYSEHLTFQLKQELSRLKDGISKGNMEKEEILKIQENIESISSTQEKLISFLNYFTETMQIVVNKVDSLETKTDDIISYNNYLGEHTNALANHNNIIAENLNNVINYADRLGNEMNNVINYTNEISEKLNYSINYTERIAEHVNNVILHVDFIGENLDTAIQYCDELGSHLDTSIKFSNYIAQHVKENADYTKMIKEEVDNHTTDIQKTIHHSNYITDGLNKITNYVGSITETLNNSSKLNESMSDIKFTSLEDAGFTPHEDDTIIDDEQPTLISNDDVIDNTNVIEEPITTINNEPETVYELEPSTTDDNTTEITNVDTTEDDLFNESMDDLDMSIDDLIQSIKLKKIEENHQPYFLTFLSESQIKAYQNLSREDKNKIKMYAEGKLFYSDLDVIKMMNEAIAVRETLEDRLMKYMPSEIQQIWDKVDENQKNAIIAQANLFPQLESVHQIVNFWNTRNININDESVKIQKFEHPILSESKFTDAEINSMIKRING